MLNSDVAFYYIQTNRLTVRQKPDVAICLFKGVKTVLKSFLKLEVSLCCSSVHCCSISDDLSCSFTLASIMN